MLQEKNRQKRNKTSQNDEDDDENNDRNISGTLLEPRETIQVWLTVTHSNPPGTVSFIRLILRPFSIVLLFPILAFSHTSSSMVNELVN